MATGNAKTWLLRYWVDFRELCSLHQCIPTRTEKQMAQEVRAPRLLHEAANLHVVHEALSVVLERARAGHHQWSMFLAIIAALARPWDPIPIYPAWMRDTWIEHACRVSIVTSDLQKCLRYTLKTTTLT